MAGGGAALVLSLAHTPTPAYADGFAAGMPACPIGNVCIYINPGLVGQGDLSTHGWVVYDANQAALANGSADINLGDLLGDLGNGNLGNGNIGNGILGNVDLNNLGDLGNTIPDAIVNCTNQILDIFGNNGALLGSVLPLSGSILQSDAATGIVPVQSVSYQSIYVVNPGVQNVSRAEVLSNHGQFGQTRQRRFVVLHRRL